MKKNSLHVDLDDLRVSIDHLDSALMFLLAERFRQVEKIGIIKKQLKQKPLAKQRWEKVLSGKIKMAKKLGIDTQLVHKVFSLIHEKSLQVQKEI